MIKYRQQICDASYGDCFRACMATLLQLPPAVLPNDHSPAWWLTWRTFLTQFGMELTPDQPADGPIWSTAPWIASVRSLNFDGGRHAILMHRGGIVYHDPSPRKRYRTGSSLLGSGGVVLSGRHLQVTDTTRLHHLELYRRRLAEGQPVAAVQPT